MEIPPLTRIAKWLVLIGGYFWAVGLCASTILIPIGLMAGSGRNTFGQLIGTGITLLTCAAPLIIVGGLMALVVLAFRRDKEREHTPSDDFKNDNLLFRYGYQINRISLSIPVQPEWSDYEISGFVDALRQRTASQIQTRFSSAGVEVINTVQIRDKQMTSDNKLFLKIVFRSKRGSQVSHFIHYAIAGKYVVIHYLSRIRGKYRWHDVVDFVITGPLSMWFWGWDWIQNQYSIISAISNIVSNSYDHIDLKTYFEASYLVLLDETRAFLKEKGLLTDEINQVINYNITNSQNISVSRSQGVNLGNIANAAQSAVQALRKPSSD